MTCYAKPCYERLETDTKTKVKFKIKYFNETEQPFSYNYNKIRVNSMPYIKNLYKIT